MNFETSIYSENRPFAHVFFFQLSDTSKSLIDDFIALCQKYLSGYEGQQHFSIGYRALEMDRDVNAKNFEVSVHMIFRDLAAFEAYTKSENHEEFITHTAGMSPGRIVYDSFLHVSVEPKA